MVFSAVVIPLMLDVLGVLLYVMICRMDRYRKTIDPESGLAVVPRGLVLCAWVCLIWPNININLVTRQLIALYYNA